MKPVDAGNKVQNMVAAVFEAAAKHTNGIVEANRLATLTVMAIAQDSTLTKREQIVEATARHLQTLRINGCGG